ncbi:YncE family protein [Paenibacillus silagei]|uniref:YVTN family beta-propeller protein n=1 Tax=Paenibacillus silagei TaxID=1670801 RepID=A0ABS4NNE6_9BACL|nr:hypothetical protein [Paenibacillus silagei]MBP2111586.1 YVTN family beta-propeller protein [Paenibacillus silagei]
MSTNMTNHHRNLSSGTNPYVFVSYELDYFFGYVAVIDPAQDKIIRRIPVGSKPGPMCLNYQEDKLYVLNTAQDTVSIIDAYTFKVITTVQIDLGGPDRRPVSLFAASNANKVYVPTQGQMAISIIDTLTNEAEQVELWLHGSAYPFAFAGHPDSHYVSIACQSADNEQGIVTAISVDDDTVHQFGDGIELAFDRSHNPLTVHPDGKTQVTLGPTGMLTYTGTNNFGVSKSSSLLDNTVSGVYLDNGLLYCTSHEDKAYLKQFKNLSIDGQGNITYDQFKEIPSYKGQDKILASRSQSYIGVSVLPTTFPTGGLQIYDVHAASSRFVPLSYIGDFAFASDTKAYVGELTSLRPINVSTATALPAIPFGSDRIAIKNIVSGYSNRSL